MKQIVRVMIEGEERDVELERDGLVLRGWVSLYGSVDAFVAAAIRYFTGATTHSEKRNYRELVEALRALAPTAAEIAAVETLGMKRLLALVRAIDRFERAEEERAEVWWSGDAQPENDPEAG